MVARTVRSYISAGVAGMHLEDQVLAKRCGHLAGQGVGSCGRVLLEDSGGGHGEGGDEEGDGRGCGVDCEDGCVADVWDGRGDDAVEEVH